MFARNTLDNYAAQLPEPERSAFTAAVSSIRGEMHGKVEIILADALELVGLSEHVRALEHGKHWLFVTNGGEDLRTLYRLRHEAGKA